jgi:hypothetical protein
MQIHSKAHPRRIVTTASIAVAFLLLMTSTAWACTTMSGVLTLSQTGQTTKSNTGDSGVGGTFCNSPASTMTLTTTASFTVSWAKNSTSMGSGGFCDTSQFTGDVSVKKYTSLSACHASGTQIGTFTLSGNPFSGSVAIGGSSIGVGDTAICTDRGAWGMDMDVSVS